LLEISRKAYGWLYKALKVASATVLLIIGFSALIYLLSIGSEIINANIKAIDDNRVFSNYFLQGFYGFLNTALWAFIIFSGAIFLIAYAIYVIDVIRGKKEENVEPESL
jgi:hypothetical protein